MATKPGTDNLEICFIRQTRKILFSHSGNSDKNGLYYFLVNLFSGVNLIHYNTIDS